MFFHQVLLQECIDDRYLVDRTQSYFDAMSAQRIQHELVDTYMKGSCENETDHRVD